MCVSIQRPGHRAKCLYLLCFGDDTKHLLNPHNPIRWDEETKAQKLQDSSSEKYI